MSFSPKTFEFHRRSPAEFKLLYFFPFSDETRFVGHSQISTSNSNRKITMSDAKAKAEARRAKILSREGSRLSIVKGELVSVPVFCVRIVGVLERRFFSLYLKEKTVLFCHICPANSNYYVNYINLVISLLSFLCSQSLLWKKVFQLTSARPAPASREPSVRRPKSMR